MTNELFRVITFLKASLKSINRSYLPAFHAEESLDVASLSFLRLFTALIIKEMKIVTKKPAKKAIISFLTRFSLTIFFVIKGSPSIETKLV